MEEAIYLSGGHGDRDDIIRTGIGKVLRIFEAYIRNYPDQWYNLFDYWQITTRDTKES